MPSTSAKQHRLMEAVAHGWHKPGGGGPSPAVAKEFVAADQGRSFAAGGQVNKGYQGKTESYAQGGAVLGRSTDFMKTPDRFRGSLQPNPKVEGTEDVWGKGSSKKNPTGKDKSEKPVKPKG